MFREKEGLSLEFAKPQLPQGMPDLALSSEVWHTLWQKALTLLQSLQTPLGVTASGQDDHFHAIFGRDSLWTVLFTLEAAQLQQAKITVEGQQSSATTSFRAWSHELAATVLRGLASLQGKIVNDVNEEQPGRIVHEYWNPIPPRMIVAHWPVIDGRYYGAFDTTFLYLITTAQVDAFFNDKVLLEELWPSVNGALHWMLDWSDLDQDGLVEYKRRNPEGIGLDNQVWKDSSEAVQLPGHLPIRHPVAWIEVQGYAWAAYAAYIALAEKRQYLDPSLHQEIRRRMQSLLKEQPRFWLDSEQYPAIALDGQKNPIAAVASNPGHLLWSGFVEKAQAELICKRLMQTDLLTPWGLRTLSDLAYYYSPLMYHAGAIWPFDNAVAAIGLQRYGFDTEAHRIALAVLEAVLAFDNPVELYTVQPSRWLRSPRIEQEWFLADYSHASTVQAWTAAAILYFIALVNQG